MTMSEDKKNGKQNKTVKPFDNLFVSLISCD